MEAPLDPATGVSYCKHSLLKDNVKITFQQGHNIEMYLVLTTQMGLVSARVLTPATEAASIVIPGVNFRLVSPDWNSVLTVL